MQLLIIVVLSGYREHFEDSGTDGNKVRNHLAIGITFLLLNTI